MRLFSSSSFPSSDNDFCRDIIVSNSSSYQNLFINAINGIIQPPGNLSQALSAVNATSFLSLAQQANVTSSSGDNVTVLDALSSLRGFTLFVPSNDAIQNASSTFSGLQNNGTAVMALLGNHVSFACLLSDYD